MSQQKPDFTHHVDLASERVGGVTLSCSDDFFAPMENLLKPKDAVFIADKYTDRGKWMDGWESRRKRTPGYDWCILRLGLPGVILGVDIDTSHFLGNHPPHASVEAAQTKSSDLASITWSEILPKVALAPGSHNYFATHSPSIYTHLRLNIFPDGGVARLKVFGDVKPDWPVLKQSGDIDLASVCNGGLVVTCNDMFFSSKDNLIMPGRGINMGDGWETKRRRTPGHDWVILRLGHRGVVKKIEVDTHHFKGNYPDTCSIEGIELPEYVDPRNATSSWHPILPQSKLSADHQHFFERELLNHPPVTHVRLNIFPDGGVSRLRLFGMPI